MAEPTAPSAKLAGTAAELATAVRLLDHGFSVSWPVGDNDCYDLIADSGSRLTRIQVKSSSTKQKGTFHVVFGHGKKKVPYTASDIDYFAVVLAYAGGPAFYLIPVEKITRMRVSFWNPGDHPLSTPRWRVCKYEQFRDRWDLLR
tara:strand:+ start:4047 stop:4481 length:435 start_codon:yes stop_codon:yes gene_type:complete